MHHDPITLQPRSPQVLLVLALLGTKNEGANPGAVPNPTEPVSGTRADVSAPSDKV